VMRGNEGYGTAVRFIHLSKEKGDGRRRTAQRRGSERRLSSTVPRRKKEKGDGWAMGRSGRVGRMPLGPARREKKEENGMGRKDDRPKWKIGFGFDFPILFQRFELKIKGFKYFQIKFELRSN
jgi:hypothetical protein